MNVQKKPAEKTALFLRGYNLRLCRASRELHKKLIQITRLFISPNEGGGKKTQSCMYAATGNDRVRGGGGGEGNHA